MIRPLTTQGHLSDVLPHQLVYDAQTTVGGSNLRASGPLTDEEKGILYPLWGISPQGDLMPQDLMALPDSTTHDCCSAPQPSPGARPSSTPGGQSLRRATLGATVTAAVAASICCIGPLAAALLGATSLGALVVFEKYRPYFAGITLLFLAGAFSMTYRKKPEACEPGSVCAVAGPARVGRINRVILWGVTVIVLLVLSFPTWSGWVWG